MRNEKSGDCPVAFIAKNKQRVKQYDDVVYLKNGDEFEIELFNPTQSKVLSRITINNVSIGPGIILRPGERVFLERYVNDPRKFKFETYTVNGNNSQVQKAIENNGDVKIDFFAEEINLYDNSYLSIDTTPITNIYYQKTIDCVPLSDKTNDVLKDVNLQSISTSVYPKKNYDFYSNETLNCTSLNSLNICQSDNTTASVTSSATMDFLGLESDSSQKYRSFLKKIDPIETGRVEKGSYSDQKFDKDYTKFNYYSSWTSAWKILPESRKQITSNDLLTYCSCGRKQRKNEKFCPSCGKKFNNVNADFKVNDTVVILDKNAISVIKEISKNGDNENIYYVPYPGDNKWYTKNQLEFNHSN